ncbi:MAG: hypothetical protein AAGD11_14540 [Planctomycetota bacterium]
MHKQAICLWATIGLTTLTSCSSGTSDDGKAPKSLDKTTFGHRQIEQMLADRPNMKGVLSEDGPTFEWIVESLNGKRTGRRIHWNADTPQSRQGSEHAGQYYYYPAQIYISGGTEMTGIDKWAALVYELYNVENTNEFSDLRDQAISGEIAGEDYAMGCVKLEFLAMEKTYAFFHKHPMPAPDTSMHRWYELMLAELGTFEQYVEDSSEFSGPGNYKHFKDYFDEHISPWVGKYPPQRADDEPSNREP